MTPAALLASIGLALAAPAAAREAPWLVAPPALAAAAAEIGGAGARIEAADDEEAAVAAYCRGLGAQTPDAMLLARRLLDRERRACLAEAITAEPERDLGLLGLALDGAPDGLTRRHLWRALAREVPAGGTLVRNRVRSWREVDAKLPERPIALRVDAAAPVVDALILASGCLGAEGYARLDRARLCRGLRADLPAAPLPLTIRPLGGGGDAVEGIQPTVADLASGRYPLARRVYLFLKRAHVPGIAGLSDVSRRAASGLVPAP